MRVIWELIEYFEQCGILKDEQINYLIREGFYPGQLDLLQGLDWLQDLKLEEQPQKSENENLEMTDDNLQVEHWEDRWDKVERRSPQKSKGGNRPKGKVIKSPELCAKIAELLQKQADLTGLVKIAQYLEPNVTYKEAPLTIYQADSDALQDILCQSFQNQRPSLCVLWNALSFDDYRLVVASDEKVRGPAVQAYRAILQGGSLKALGKYAWLLREAEINYIYYIIQAQRKLLSVCGQIYRENSQLIERALRREDHPVAYLAFLLAYNAQNFQPSLVQLQSSPSEKIYILQRPVPNFTDWQKAWSQAWLMEPKSFPHLFSDYFKYWQRDYDDTSLTYADLNLRYPTTWNF